MLRRVLTRVFASLGFASLARRLGLRARASIANARPLSALPHLSVVICSIDDERFGRISANLAQRLSGISHEVIRIDDASSLAEGYNRGLDRSRADLLIFCHDDIELLQTDVAARLLAQLKHHDVVGVAGTTRLMDSHWGSAGAPATHGQVLQPLEGNEGYVLNVFCQDDDARDASHHNIQALDGLFIAARRDAALALRFDAATFDGFHLYDLDFSFRAHLAGYRVGVCHDILIYHQSNGHKDAVWQGYGVRFEDKYAAQLSREPAGPPLVYQVRVPDKAGGLAAFSRVMKGEMVFR